MAKYVWVADTNNWCVNSRCVLTTTLTDVWREEGQLPGKFIYRESRSQAVIDLCNAIDEEVVKLLKIKKNYKECEDV